MPNKKKFVAAAALTASLAAGGAVGAVFGTPTLSLAQEEGTSERTESAHSSRRNGRSGPGHRVHHRREALAAAAEALGMTPEDLRTELRAGKSIAAVADERNVEVQTVIDAMVAEATANIEERVTEFVNRSRPAGAEGRPAEETAA